MPFLGKTGEQLARALFAVAATAIVAMMLLTCADVVLRLFRRPIPGTYELVSFFSAVAVAFAMAHTTRSKGHIAVSILVQLLPKRLQAAVDALTSAASALLFALIAWRTALYAGELRQAREVSLTLELPFHPFVYGVAFSAAAVCLICLSQLGDHLKGALKR